MAHFDGCVIRRSFASMLDGRHDQEAAARMQAFFDRGVADAKAGKPMLRTFEHLGGLYWTAEGSEYERGWWSVEHKRRRAARKHCTQQQSLWGE